MNSTQTGRYSLTTSSSLFENNMSSLNPEKQKAMANPDCEMCEGSGIVEEGEFDDIRDVPCPCTLEQEPADFTGATEGDR